jgi:hypothetical protein
MPGISVAHRLPVTLHINAICARAYIITIYVNISATAPGPFARHPVGAGIWWSGTNIYRLCRTIGNIIIAGA